TLRAKIGAVILPLGQPLSAPRPARPPAPPPAFDLRLQPRQPSGRGLLAARSPPSPRERLRGEGLRKRHAPHGGDDPGGRWGSGLSGPRRSPPPPGASVRPLPLPDACAPSILAGGNQPPPPRRQEPTPMLPDPITRRAALGTALTAAGAALGSAAPDAGA